MQSGNSFPEASRIAYQQIGLTNEQMDLSQPNNILGFSYIKTIFEHNLPIKPLTIKRTSSHYHDETITSTIASATSIRKQLFQRSEERRVGRERRTQWSQADARTRDS